MGLALSDAPVALGALAVADAEAPDAGRTRDGDPVVSSGQIAVSFDLHAESAWVLDRIRVAVEVARDEAGPALVQAEAPLRGRDDEPRRSSAVRLAVGELPAGPYLARVRVLRGAEESTLIHRPFRIAE